MSDNYTRMMTGAPEVLAQNENLCAALSDLAHLVELWMNGPMMSRITWIEPPPALAKAREVLAEIARLKALETKDGK